MDEKRTQADETLVAAADPAPSESPDTAPNATAEQGVGSASVDDATPIPADIEDAAPAASAEPSKSETAQQNEAPVQAESQASSDTPVEAAQADAPVATEEATQQDEQVSAQSASDAPQTEAVQPEPAQAAPAQSEPSMTMEDVMAASDEQLAKPPVHRGKILTGTVIMLSQEGLVLDVGAKIEGLLPYSQLFEFETTQVDAAKYFKTGDEIQVYVVRSDIPNNVIILSKKRADQERAWNLLQDIYDKKLPVEVEIVDKVRGGLVANLGVRAFLPASQVDIRRISDLDPFVGQRLKVKIIELNRKRNRVIVSRRAILEEEVAGLKEETLKKLEPGLQLEGEVVEITDFGVFVNLGGVDGLVHRSELSHGRFNHPREVVRMGDKVKVEVLDMDLERERINLSVKKLNPDPWENVLLNYAIGQRIGGKVTNLTPFGAFVEIEPGLEGLIHVSEMSWTKRIRHPKEAVTEGEDVEAMVLKIDPDQQRISLGLRQTQPDPWSSLPDRFPPGTEVTGPITGITDFGVFMEIEEGIEGLVHISELAHEHIDVIEEHFNRGDEVTAVILNIDPVEQRASLSRKRLLPFTAGAGGDFDGSMPLGAPSSRGGRKGRRGGRRSQVIDYDYSYASSDSNTKATTKLGDVYADLFAQFGLTETKDEDEVQGDSVEAKSENTSQAEQTQEDAAPSQASEVSSPEGEGAAEAEPQATQANSPEPEEEVDPENAIDAAEAAALLTAAFREGRRPANLNASATNEATVTEDKDDSGSSAEEAVEPEASSETTMPSSDNTETSSEDAIVAAETAEEDAVTTATNEEAAETPEKTEA